MVSRCHNVVRLEKYLWREMMDKKTNEKAPSGSVFPENGVPIFVPWKQEKENVIVCEVCGHKNQENTAICVMCSNYLR